MNRQEYNRMIEETLKTKPAQTENSLETARAVFNNMGISLPQGDLKQVSEALATDDYMGWRKCTVKEAQEYANNGTAVVGVSDDQIAVVAANEGQGAVTSSAVMTLDENTSALAVSDTAFYASRAGSTSETPSNSNIHFEQSNMNQTVGWSGYCQVPSDCSIMMTNFVSSNPQVASIEYVSGIITAHQVGTTTITAITTDGYSASYTFEVKEFSRYERIEDTVCGSIVHDLGVSVQAFLVELSFSYTIVAKQGNNVKIGTVKVSAGYHKGAVIAGADYPSIGVGLTEINGNQIDIINDPGPFIQPIDYVSSNKMAVVNQWVPLGTIAKTMAVLMLNGAIFGYREVNLETTITI